MVLHLGQYQDMLASFEAAGFLEPMTEYLYLDNTKGNRFDAFSAIRHFLTHARGQFIILCHQDILLNHDRLDRLEACIRELNQRDPKWALLGNGGGEKLYRTVVRISDPHGESKPECLPKKVQSLDENFILLRRDCNPGVSCDLEGFHLYGLDLCRQAAWRGYSAYVVNFHLTHLSAGTRDAAFLAARSRLISKYRQATAGGYFQTTCTTVYLSGSSFWSTVMNKKFILKWLKSYLKRRGVVACSPTSNQEQSAPCRQRRA